MKKTIALALLLGFGMLVGCGEEPKKPATGSGAKTTAAAPATPAPSGDKK